MDKVLVFFMSMITAFLSFFGYSFTHTDKTLPVVIKDSSLTAAPNENTAAIKERTEKVKLRTPTLTRCPENDPYKDDSRIKAYFFDGEEYNGKAARVFAYIGFPENASEDSPVPAMVLVHGGAGHAYAEWVRQWVDYGYAAISFDGFGQMPPQEPYRQDAVWPLDPASHPTIDSFASANEPLDRQFFYYYLTDVILAHNILRADSRVIPDKTGVTGISWGSYATTAVLGYDDRFAFAVPVYGSAYQDESTGLFAFAANVKDLWEPSLLLPDVKTDILFLNSDSDIFFTANTTAKSAAAAENAGILYLNAYGHSQSEGAAPEEIHRFANEHTGLGKGNIKITKISTDGKKIIADYTLPADVSGAKIKVYYRNSPLAYHRDAPYTIIDRWKCRKGIAIGGTGCVRMPAKADTFYVSIEAADGKGNKIHASTGLYSAADIEE